MRTQVAGCAVLIAVAAYPPVRRHLGTDDRDAGLAAARGARGTGLLPVIQGHAGGVSPGSLTTTERSRTDLCYGFRVPRFARSRNDNGALSRAFRNEQRPTRSCAARPPGVELRAAECSAARLAHQSGGLGVPSSNLG